jgi:hypothetical protein
MEAIQIQQSMPPDFDLVQLDQNEHEKVIYEARLQKWNKLQEQIRKNVTQLEMDEAKRPWKYDELRKLVLDANPDYILDQYSEPVFEILCYYFIRDEVNFKIKMDEYAKKLPGDFYEKYGGTFSIYKSIALGAVPGAGKTRLIKMFQKNKWRCFMVETMERINECCSESSKDYYINFVGPAQRYIGHKSQFYQNEVGWCIDDVGREEVINTYGNKFSPFADIIKHRYDSKELRQYYHVHITFMLTTKQLEERYGSFILSRMREMYNFIPLLGGDRRR